MVARDVDGQFAKLALDCLAVLAVTGVAGCVGDGIVLGVAQMAFHVGLQGALDDGLGDLLEQAVFVADQVFGFLIARHQAVNQPCG